MRRVFPLLISSLLCLGACRQSDTPSQGGVKEQPGGAKEAASAPAPPAGKGFAKAGELYPVLKGGKWGYMNHEGKIVIEPKYLRGTRFFEDLALVANEKNKVGYINREGKVVVDIKFDGASPFSEGYAAAYEGRKAGVINTKGEWVLPPKYTRVGRFRDGLAPAVIVREVNPQLKAEDGGYIDINGKFVILPQFDPGLTSFNEDLAGVRRVGQLWSFIDKTGKTVIAPKWFMVGQFAEGLAGAMDEKNRWGYIDKNGAVMITPKFRQVRFFSEGLAGVMSNEVPKWGFINKKGEIVIKQQFDGVDQFLDGIAMVQLGEKIAYINTSGQYVWEPTQ